jgi:hypothetical protein
VVGPSVEVVADVAAVEVTRVGWARPDDHVAWLPNGPHPRPTLPCRVERDERVRWMVTREELIAALGPDLDPAAALAPVAMVDGALLTAEASVRLDSSTGGRPNDLRPPSGVVDGPLGDLAARERSITSQNGEDGVLEAIFGVIGTTNRVLVEFGCGDAVECNSAQLILQGWTGLLMDPFTTSANPRIEIRREFVTAENVERLFDVYGVPAAFDLLSVDIDGNDLWVWKAIKRRPRVVVIETNSHVSPRLSRVLPYDPGHRWDGTDQFGASLRALETLGRCMGYTLVHVESRGVNAFLVADECLPRGFVPRALDDLYRQPDYLGLGLAYPSAAEPRMVDFRADDGCRDASG